MVTSCRVGRIPSHDLTTSPKYDPRTTSIVEPDLSHENEAPAFGTNIGEPVFDSPLLTPATIAWDDMLEFGRYGDQSGDTKPLNSPSPQSLIVLAFNKKKKKKREKIE